MKAKLNDWNEFRWNIDGKFSIFFNMKRGSSIEVIKRGEIKKVKEFIPRQSKYSIHIQISITN